MTVMIRMLPAAEANQPAAPAVRLAGRRHPLAAHFESLYRRIAGTTLAGRPISSVGVASCGPGEGVSLVAAQLALAAARLSREPVLLVDANLENAHVSRTFGVRPRPGLAELLSGLPEDECLQPAGIEKLMLLTAGSSAGGESVGEAMQTLPELVRRWREEFHLVVFDLPPLSGLGPGGWISSHLDGALLVLDAERARGDDAFRAKRRLEQSGGRLLGAVWNKGREG